MSENVLEVDRHGGSTRLTLSGSMDISRAGDLKKELGKTLRRKPPLLIDCSGVERVDTAGVQVLLAFAGAAEEKGVELVWQSPSESVQNAFRIMGLEKIIGL